MKGNSNSNLNYIDDFEIIDREFVAFLANSYNSRNMIPIKYVIIEGKIFLIIYLEKTCLYEIVNLENGNYNVEYLIEITNNQKAENDYILEIFRLKGIQKLINTQNPITDNIITFNLYPIQTTLHKNQSPNQENTNSIIDKISEHSIKRSTYGDRSAIASFLFM